GLARRLLRARLGERLHAPPGERVRRVRRPEVRIVDEPPPVVLVLALPALAQLFESFVRWAGATQFYVGGNRIDLSGSRLALCVAGLMVVGAGINTRRLLRRYRLSRPVPLTLVPKLK